MHVRTVAISLASQNAPICGLPWQDRAQHGHVGLVHAHGSYQLAPTCRMPKQGAAQKHASFVHGCVAQLGCGVRDRIQV